MKYFIVDAETDGLYGVFLSVAAQVYDEEWNWIDEFYGAVRKKIDEIQEKWVRENVYPYLYQRSCIYKKEEELLDDFWDFWMKYKRCEEIYCFADVPYPVESRLFIQCVEKNREERAFQAPFPLYDLESILNANGIGVLIDRKMLLGSVENSEYCRHNALDDVRMTARLLEMYWKEEK